jgi:hypothetical protein
MRRPDQPPRETPTRGGAIEAGGEAVSSSGCGIIGVASILHAASARSSDMIRVMASIVVRPGDAAAAGGVPPAARGFAKIA